MTTVTHESEPYQAVSQDPGFQVFSEPGTETKMTFDNSHLADLAASGIKAETAIEAGLHSAIAADLAKLLGFSLPAETTGLVFPYGQETEYFRVKLFPPLAGDKGTMRYAQPKGTGVRLYIPPLARQVLKNPTMPLMITEGEKKALKACQEGLACLGIGGLWSWICDGEPIPDLDEIAWIERPVTIVPDSDVWTRPDLIQPVYALGKELESRGAKVLVCIIPQGGEKKLGLDDFLVVQGRTGFDALKQIPLTHKGFKQGREWHREWIKGKQISEQPPEAEKLLESMAQFQRLHPAQDYVNGVLWYGVPVDDNVVLINSDRQLITEDQLPQGLKLDNRGFDLCRFSKEGINAFRAGDTVDGMRLASELRDYFGRYMIVRDKRVYLLLALWTIGTYVYRVFRVFPYLSLRSPTKECGKSRTEDLLSVICFNAGNRETSPTEAALFRGPGKNGGTVLLDEIEGLKSNRDRFSNLLAVLNSGFERGGSVTRMEKRGDKFVDVSYPTFCPRVLAGINRLTDTLEGRGITIFLERKLRTEKVERFSKARVFGSMQETRDRLYMWALTRARDLAQVYDQIDRFDALEGLGDRERDLWEPLASIALLCDSENGEKRSLTDELCALAHDLSKVRAEIDTANVMQLIRVLETVLEGKQEVRISPTDLFKRFKEDHYFVEWLKSAKALAGQLAPLGIISNSHRDPETGKPARRYKLDAATVEDCKNRYGSGE